MSVSFVERAVIFTLYEEQHDQARLELTGDSASRSIRQIAKYMYMQDSTVMNVLHLAGVPMRKRGAQEGKMNPMSYTEEQIEEAKFYYEAGFNTTEIAKFIGCSTSSVVRRLHFGGVKMRSRAESTRLRWIRKRNETGIDRNDSVGFHRGSLGESGGQGMGRTQEEGRKGALRNGRGNHRANAQEEATRR